MSSLPRREPKISEAVLEHWETNKNSPIWDACFRAFERMFSFPNDIDEEHVETETERLFPPEEPGWDWSWYVTSRWSPDAVLAEHKYEAELKGLLFGSEPHRLVYLIGHTGVGKSTFLRYFFSSYLPTHGNLANGHLKKLCPVKIPLSHQTVENLERAWDDRVLQFLYREFAELQNQQFLRNLARHMLFQCKKERRLEMDISGELLPQQFEPGYVRDVNHRIADTLGGIDQPSVLAWLEESITCIKGQPPGLLFNRNVVQLLSKYYGYEFIFIVDNIDDLPQTIQHEILRLLSEKMRIYAAYDRVKFIIATRDNVFEPVASETLPVASGMHHRILRLPPLPFGDVLRMRKSTFFDPLKREGTGTVAITPTTSVKIEGIDVFMDAIFSVFDNVKPLTELHKLCNHNTRRMLDIVQAVFRSPHMDPQFLHEVVDASTLQSTLIRSKVAREFVSSHRILDAAVRGGNHLVVLKSNNQMPNMFFSGSANHYSSSLSRMFALAVVVSDASVTLAELISILTDLGHPESTVSKAVSDLLQMHLIFSAKGFSIPEKEGDWRSFTLEHRDLPFGTYLLYSICTQLRYLQSMGYITPLEQQYREMITLPDKVGGPVRDFKDRLTAASALYQQFIADMKSQLEYLGTGPESSRLKLIVKRFSFLTIAENMHDGVLRDFERIAKQRPEFVRNIKIDECFPAPPTLS